MYGEFARCYDALMDDVDYDGWAAHYLALMRARGVSPRAVAECACGTGSLTVRLAQAGVSVIGVDSSPDMLRVAADKARARGVHIPFVCQDMRALTLHKPVDAVLATCDGVNYLCAPEAARGFFAAAFAALRPGGGIFFDVSSYGKLTQVLGDAFYGETRAQAAYLWQNHFNPATAVVDMDLTGFVREADGRYRRFDEIHRQRAHTEAELSAWLTDAGFADVAVYGERGFAPPTPDDQRWHVSALKPRPAAAG